MTKCAGIQKISSTIFFLYFALIMPCIAFGVLHHYITHGIIDVRKVVLSQAFSGLLYSAFGGQPLIIVRTTVPIAIYTKGTMQLANKPQGTARVVQGINLPSNSLLKESSY